MKFSLHSATNKLCSVASIRCNSEAEVQCLKISCIHHAPHDLHLIYTSPPERNRLST